MNTIGTKELLEIAATEIAGIKGAPGWILEAVSSPDANALWNRIAQSRAPTGRCHFGTLECSPGNVGAGVHLPRSKLFEDDAAYQSFIARLVVWCAIASQWHLDTSSRVPLGSALRRQRRKIAQCARELAELLNADPFLKRFDVVDLCHLLLDPDTRPGRNSYHYVVKHREQESTAYHMHLALSVAMESLAVSLLSVEGKVVQTELDPEFVDARGGGAERSQVTSFVDLLIPGLRAAKFRGYRELLSESVSVLFGIVRNKDTMVRNHEKRASQHAAPRSFDHHQDDLLQPGPFSLERVLIARAPPKN